MELVGDDDGPAVEVDEGDVIACELAHAEIDRDGALGRHVRVNVSNSMSFQACIEDIVNGVADELSPTPALPHGVRADTSVFTPWKHCAIKGCRWVYHGHAATSSNEGHQRLAKHLEEAHADLFHKRQHR